MPFPVALAAGAGQAAGAMINAFSQGSQNRKNRKWSEMMYDRQFSDNIALWNLQNEYNTPSAQMARLEDAGLNPALMYGQSASGAAGNAQSAKGADYKTPNTGTPEYGNAISTALPTLMAYYDLEQKKAQINNLETDNTIKIEDHLLRQSQRKTSEFNLELESELRDVSLQARKEDLRKKKAEADMVINEDERKAAKNSSDLREAANRILNMRETRAKTKAEVDRIRAAIKGVNRDNTLKDLDIELRQLRINPNDPMIFRILGGILNQYLENDFNY